MSQQYVRELARRKTVADFMRRDFFHADAGDKITDVLSRLLAHDPQLKTDSIIVSSRGRYRGTVAVSNMILALSLTQKRLLEQLDALSPLRPPCLPHPGLGPGCWSLAAAVGRCVSRAQSRAIFHESV